MRISSSLIATLVGSILGGSSDTPNQKLKKHFRKSIEIVNLMKNTKVTKEEAAQAIGDTGNVEDEITRRSEGMISDRVHKAWVTKIVKQTSFLSKKYNSKDCKKFGNPFQDDYSTVWAEISTTKIKDEYNLFDKLIWPQTEASLGARARPSDSGPLTNLWLQFSRWRLWINENIGSCLDENGPKYNLAGATRVKKWRNKAHKKIQHPGETCLQPSPKGPCKDES